MVTDRHTAKELAIFNRFAVASGLAIVQDSVEKLPPPEPDILCNVVGLGDVAFELVELIDEDLAGRSFGQLRLKSMFEESFETCAPSIKAALLSTIGNALVHVTFANVGLRQRQSSVVDVFNFLRTIDSDCEGTLTPESLASTVESIRVARLDIVGPCFDVDAVGCFGDPTLGSIQGKWSKRYETPHRRELLAYYELQPELPNELWRPTLESFLQQHWSSSPFQRLWVYDCATRRIVYTAERPQ